MYVYKALILAVPEDCYTIFELPYMEPDCGPQCRNGTFANWWLGKKARYGESNFMVDLLQNHNVMVCAKHEARIGFNQLSC